MAIFMIHVFSLLSPLKESKVRYTLTKVSCDASSASDLSHRYTALPVVQIPDPDVEHCQGP